MFTENELALLNTALDQSLASNKRLQASRPQFSVVWRQVESDLLAVKAKVNTPPTKPK